MDTLHMEQLTQLGIIPVDYSVLESLLTQYASHGHKIADLEKSGQLVRLKKGLYVVSPIVSGKLLSTELIANHIYGPSYVSMESALRYHGLIPENVSTVKWMTTKRARQINNSIAKFDYLSCAEKYFPLGVQQEQKDGYSFLISSPEKALCDLITATPNIRPRFIKSIQLFLEEDLRLDMDAFFSMNVVVFRACAEVGKKKKDIDNLIKLIER